MIFGITILVTAAVAVPLLLIAQPVHFVPQLLSSPESHGGDRGIEHLAFLGPRVAIRCQER